MSKVTSVNTLLEDLQKAKANLMPNPHIRVFNGLDKKGVRKILLLKLL
jgi:hypothetical protein